LYLLYFKVLTIDGTFFFGAVFGPLKRGRRVHTLATFAWASSRQNAALEIQGARLWRRYLCGPRFFGPGDAAATSLGGAAKWTNFGGKYIHRHKKNASAFSSVCSCVSVKVEIVDKVFANPPPSLLFFGGGRHFFGFFFFKPFFCKKSLSTISTLTDTQGTTKKKCRGIFL
jgi:hypothetical protein